MDPFHISEVLRSKSRHILLNLFSGKWKLPQIYFFVLPFAASIKFAVALWDFVWETLMRQH